MNGYSYRLHTDKGRDRSRLLIRYSREELEDMTTFQLRNICYTERLVEGVANKLDREALIDTILKFRGSVGSLLIRGFHKGGFQRIEEAIHTYLKTPLSNQVRIKVPAKISLYRGLKVDKLDQYLVEAIGMQESNVLLINDSMELCGVLHLKKDESQPELYYLAMDRNTELRRTANQNYSLLFFRKQDSEYLYRAYYQDAPLLPANLHYCKVPVTDLEICELEETGAVLAIDFGTSNTTAGAYLDSGYISTPPSHDLLNGQIRLNEINYVKFPDETEQSTDWVAVVPTIVSVADCRDQENIQYHFGYEALSHRKKNGFSSQSSQFQGLKRWVNAYTKTEEIVDMEGNTAYVKRSDILRGFLTHIVEMAEHQFKCRFTHLHISSPVKLKTQFIEMFHEILPQYQIEAKDALDEGMAVLYNTIADQIEKNRFLDGEEYRALVIDCGGGTTDLSSCQFSILDGHISYKIDIHTTYENGDTNFGGNNITYRIMQFMKIVFANYYTKRRMNTDIDELIPIPATDLYRYVDEYGVGAVYENFEASYLEADRFIPTQFKMYENRSREEYHRVRNNFYFLWELAENMKKEFFRRTGILRNRFQSDASEDSDNDLKITKMDRWFLSVLHQGVFREEYEFPNVVFTIREISQLIRADIYEIVRKFLDEYYQDGRLQDFSIIKLTGQSCRIDVFREALKEFVPGRSIEFKQKIEETGKVSDLKLACLRGSLRYLSAKKSGFIEASITNHAPIIPYSVSAFTHNQHEKTLINSLERANQVQGFISRPIAVREIQFFLKDAKGNPRHHYVFINQPESYKQMVYEQIASIYPGKIPQDDTDSIINGEVKFFVFTDEKSWGFYIVPVARQNEQLYLGKKQFFAFENDLSELDFFDGLK
ncbi:molecular chaperone [Brevibacillus laterosporus]|uniref:molecular chaperone n=1 Tax=Brevibacillus laterosporus TaxID=1465 RepID=UPI0018CCEE7B|nr:molecular chaperone [Brevibacillus laterosporus]MBG9796350.1 molecular chaperone [Brevibacillus laterosporus]MCR8937362.1 molecular chaperone [Brevibacillus laterosporus]MCZ0840001.1 molecular chaperone [Brevibacillus laterosporus]MCZ0843429.1 molecular chaperone [Brevibacillus laterosporus]MED1910079.1 molecular chaperone [Brevibacillus laterosporus]